MIQTLPLVALGGALGTTARYLVSVAALRAFGPGFPVATMAVNISGSFLMGVLVVWLAHVGGQRFAPFLMTGVLGGYTTFSAFSLDAATLWERGAQDLPGPYTQRTLPPTMTALISGVAVSLWNAA